MPIVMSETSREKIPHSCLVKMQSVYDSLKSAEKKAADLLLSEPTYLESASIIEAALRAGCSEATFTRLAKKLGYLGYPELKSHLTEGEVKQNASLYEDISETDDSESVFKKVFEASVCALNDTLNMMDMGAYNKAVQALCEAQKIVFCGVGDAATVALSGYQKLMRLGLDVHASADPDVQLISAARLQPKDVLIAISHSGKTKTIVDVVKFAKNTGATVICITNYPVSPLTKNSDIVLRTAAFKQHHEGEIMSKRITELCIIESLYVNLFLKRKAELSGQLDLSNHALEINKL